MLREQLSAVWSSVIAHLMVAIPAIENVVFSIFLLVVQVYMEFNRAVGKNLKQQLYEVLLT